MKTITTIFLSTFLVCLSLLRQETQPARGGGLAERFKQLDRNGDGKVTREEAMQLPMFDQWDTNKDGAVTLEEVTAFYTKRRTINPSESKTPEDFVPDAPFVGEVNGSYIDPATGLFNAATGHDYLVDENITIIFDRPPQGRKSSNNGPEWTRDANGQHLRRMRTVEK